jgi:tripartite-type tricarboxylate transporter receptor subunit TctC
MNHNRTLACAALLAAALSGNVAAQAYPAKVVRWIVPMPPGGGTDMISRTVIQKLSELWGVQVVADNRPGAGGTIGMEAAARAPADGYTIVLGQAANLAVAPGLYSRLPYDPAKDFAPVTNVIAAPNVIISHPSLPSRNLKEVIAVARAKPNEITFASSGNGTIGHLSMEMLKSEARISLLHIPYNGGARALTALLSGEVVVFASSLPPAVPHIKAGRLKAHGVTSAKRLAPLPDVPTVAESGVPGYEAVNWYGVLVPAGVPKEIIARLHADITKILRAPDVQSRFASEGGDIVADTPEQFGAFIRKEIPKWSNVVRAAKVKVD